jgi:ABC-type multidrug transport system fused ATPase/permease subunit
VEKSAKNRERVQSADCVLFWHAKKKKTWVSLYSCLLENLIRLLSCECASIVFVFFVAHISLRFSSFRGYELSNVSFLCVGVFLSLMSWSFLGRLSMVCCVLHRALSSFMTSVTRSGLFSSLVSHHMTLCMQRLSLFSLTRNNKNPWWWPLHCHWRTPAPYPHPRAALSLTLSFCFRLSSHLPAHLPFWLLTVRFCACFSRVLIIQGESNCFTAVSAKKNVVFACLSRMCYQGFALFNARTCF